MAQALVISEALIYNRVGGPMETAQKREGELHLSTQASDVLLENQRLLQRVSQLEVERDILRGAAPKKALSIISGAAPANRPEDAL